MLDNLTIPDVIGEIGCKFRNLKEYLVVKDRERGEDLEAVADRCERGAAEAVKGLEVKTNHELYGLKQGHQKSMTQLKEEYTEMNQEVRQNLDGQAAALSSRCE